MITDNYFLSEKFKKDQEMSHKLCDEHIMRLKLKDGITDKKRIPDSLENCGETKEDKAKKYAEGLNKVGQSFDIYYVEQAFLDGWEECMKYLQSLPLDEASNRILYHGTKIGDKSTFND